MKRLISVMFILLLFVIIYLPAFTVLADENNDIDMIASLDTDVQSPGAKVSVNLTLDTHNDVEVSMLSFSVDFDSTLLSYKKYSLSGELSQGKTKVVLNNNKLTVCWFSDSGNILLGKDRQYPLIDIIFYVNENAITPTEAYVNICSLSIVDTEYNSLKVKAPDSLKLKINYPEKENVALKKLEPSSGSLMPSFDPNITEYNMTVDSSVNEITFTAEPEDETASVKVNRKKLQGYDSTTEFKITVYAGSTGSTTKMAYSVSVYRGEKTSSQVADTESKNTSTSTAKLSSTKDTTSSKLSSTTKNSSTAGTRFSDNISDNDGSLYVKDESYDIPQSISLGYNTGKITAIVFCIILSIIAVVIVFYKKRTKKPNRYIKKQNHK